MFSNSICFSTFVFGTASLTEPGAQWFGSELKRSVCLCPPALVLHVPASPLAFYLGSGDPDSGPFSYLANISPNGHVSAALNVNSWLDHFSSEWLIFLEGTKGKAVLFKEKAIFLFIFGTFPLGRHSSKRHGVCCMPELLICTGPVCFVTLFSCGCFLYQLLPPSSFLLITNSLVLPSVMSVCLVSQDSLGE